MSDLWGEVEEEDETAVEAILQSIQGKFRNGFSNFDLPTLYQPSTSHRGPKKEVSKRSLTWLRMPVDTFGQNYLLHSIDLQHYRKRMKYMFSAAQSHQLDAMKAGPTESIPLPSPPPPPKRYCSNDGILKSNSKQGFLSIEYDASKGPVHQFNEFKPVECPIELDPVSSRQLLLKSVSAVCAHAGFEFGSESAVNTLTDVFVEYFGKLCKLFKINVENQTGGEKNIEMIYHSLEHTLNDFGINGILSLQEYWNNKVRQVALKLEKESMDLLTDYNAQKESTNDKRKAIKEEVTDS